MSAFIKSIVRCSASSLVLFGLVSSIGTAAQARDAEQAPFSGIAGSWSGDGTIAMSDGTRERIRCRAVYSSPALADALNQSLRCASDSYQFDVRSYVQATPDGGLTGTFSEAVYGVSGDVSGRVAGGHIETSVDALGFSAHLSVSTQGKRQSVSIRPAGGDVESVTITMQRI